MNRTLTRQLIEHRGSIFSYIRAIVRNTNDAEDIFQDVAAIIIENAGKDIEVENFRGWSFEIARRKTLEFIRKERSGKEIRMPGEDMENLIYDIYTNHTSDASFIKERYSALTKCLRKMSAKHLKLIRLRFKEDKPFKEIAEIAGKSESAIYKAISTIRLALADCIKRNVQTAEKES